jgi:hypothetical protein
MRKRAEYRLLKKELVQKAAAPTAPAVIPTTTS